MDDLYQILEVEPAATPEDVRKAYYRLAKIYHPDLQAEEDSEATERFLSIQKAYKILSEPGDRRSYDRQLQAASQDQADSAEPSSPKKKWGAKQSSIQEERNARMAFMKSEQLIESGYVEKTIQIMEAVIRTVPDQAEYQSLYGYALALNGERLHRARDACRRAVEAEPHNADFHAHLGYVYLRAGLKQTAEGCFAEALRINPGQAVALENSGEDKKSSSGLLGGIKRIFSKS